MAGLVNARIVKESVATCEEFLVQTRQRGLGLTEKLMEKDS